MESLAKADIEFCREIVFAQLDQLISKNAFSVVEAAINNQNFILSIPESTLLQIADRFASLMNLAVKF